MKNINHILVPLFLLAFLRVANNVLVGLATPLYYIEEGLNPTILGLIMSATASVYCFSPLLFRNVPKKIGIKNSLIISNSGFLIVQIGYQISMDPILGYILRLMDGAFLGLFWPVIQGYISIISDFEGIRENDELKDQFLRHYSLSWNMGGIISYALGTIVLFFIEDVLLIFDISLIYAIIGFVLVLIYKVPKSSSTFTREAMPPDEIKLKANSQREYVKFPIFIPLFIISIYALSISAVGLIYPAKSEFLNFALFSNYLFFFIRLGTQAYFISQSMHLSINSFKKIMPYIMIALFFLLLMWGLTENLIIIGILFALFGVCLSIFYNFAFKLVIFRNIAKNTTKYSIYFETVIGIFFFLGPIVSGFLIAIDINYAFYIISFIAFLSFIVYLSLKNKIKSVEMKQKEN